jgi:dolichol kinase
MAAGRTAALWILGTLSAAAAVLEAVRLARPRVNQALVRLFGGIHREHEIRRPSGILWTLLGCFLTVLTVGRADAAAGILCLALGDAAAGLAGRAWGRSLFRGKSLAGGAACFFTCWIIGLAALRAPFTAADAAWAALAAALTEFFTPPPNDNLWMPLLSGWTLMLLL